MLAGELYRADDPELVADGRRCQALLLAFNAEQDADGRLALLRELFGAIGRASVVKPPFACDYGYNITLGAGVFVNFNAVVLDCAPVAIGDGVQIGPGVQLLAADHPREPDLRRAGLESAAAVTVEANVWIGGGAIVCPGVTIGADSVVGAGSVVTQSIPAGVVAAGNPCRVIRPLGPPAGPGR
jgi:maltose O-acetyltransferase